MKTGKNTGNSAKKRAPKTELTKVMLVDAYELARNGMGNGEIARELGISPAAFRKKVERDGELKMVLARARQLVVRKNKGFAGYVYGNLPKELRRTWNKVMKLEVMKHKLEEDDGSVAWNRVDRAARRVKAIIGGHGKKFKQMLYLHALVHNRFNASKTMKMLDIPRMTLERWMGESPMFGRLVKEVVEVKMDYVDGALMQLIERGSEAAIIFAAKTLCRGRGYGDRLDVNVEKNVTHSLDLSALGLSPATMRELLTAIRNNTKEAPRLEHRPDSNVIADAEFEVKRPKKRVRK